MYVCSSLNAVNLIQKPRPLVIGERLNVLGSASTKKCMLEGDIDGLVNIAVQQVEKEGAHCIDVCMANTEGVDEKELVVKLVKRLSAEVNAPLVIDSTEHEVIAAAVRQTAGRPIINSISLEDGRFDENIQTMLTYGCPAIAMCAGPQGVVKTAREKVALAREIYMLAVERGIKPSQLIFDPSAFTLCTGDRELRHTAVETLNAIRDIKREFPESLTSLGLSNVSFGLKPSARRVLNSVFLYHAIQAGLDAAIINMSRITAYVDIPQNERELAERVIFNKDDDAETDFIMYFDDVGDSTADKTDELEGMEPAKKCTYKIIHRMSEGLVEDVMASIRGDTPLERHNSALVVLNDSLLPAMKVVGDAFGNGELILPYVLRSAECMKMAVGELEKHLMSNEGASKGVVVLGTVYGDVHDIGKNLVKTIFENNGYTVHDLGKQVHVNKFADKIRETNADAVGLSALLVHTSKQMKLFAEHALQNDIDIPILCGGAAINSDYIHRTALDVQYPSGMWYCKDMFAGLRVVDRITRDKSGMLSEYAKTISRPVKERAVREHIREKITPVNTPPTPRMMRTIHIRDVSFSGQNIWDMFDKKSLFKLSWGVRGRGADSATVAEFERLFVELQARIEDNGWFEPYIVYGFFECSGDGDTLHIRDADFDFPRGSVCLADYFGKNDVCALQIVSVGSKIEKIIEAYNREDRYTDAYYLHGMAVEGAEALAEYANRLVCREWGVEKALRYSWGYPSCPDTTQHHRVWELLKPDNTLQLTEAGQIVPEFSTAALVVHHPKAKYFTT